jgi:hypothetical protein
MEKTRPTELTLLLKRRPDRDGGSVGVAYTAFDVCWPDGRAVDMTVDRFCQHGTRLLVGRRQAPDPALVRLGIYPVEGLEAPLTRPGPGVRCRRFYTLLSGDKVRLYFFTGTATELTVDPVRDDRDLISWLQVERMRPGEPYWFDMTGQLVAHG